MKREEDMGSNWMKRESRRERKRTREVRGWKGIVENRAWIEEVG